METTLARIKAEAERTPERRTSAVSEQGVSSRVSRARAV